MLVVGSIKSSELPNLWVVNKLNVKSIQPYSLVPLFSAVGIPRGGAKHLTFITLVSD